MSVPTVGVEPKVGELDLAAGNSEKVAPVGVVVSAGITTGASVGSLEEASLPLGSIEITSVGGNVSWSIRIMGFGVGVFDGETVGLSVVNLSVGKTVSVFFDGDSVGLSVGFSDGDEVGLSDVGESVSRRVGFSVGDGGGTPQKTGFGVGVAIGGVCVGCSVGAFVGESDGGEVGGELGFFDGEEVGLRLRGIVGEGVRSFVGRLVGSFVGRGVGLSVGFPVTSIFDVGG